MNFDPEGNDYDYQSAYSSGGRPDDSGHWGSLDPRTGMVLKGRKHPTWNLMVEEENKRGNKIIKKDGRYYSVPINKLNAEDLQFFQNLIPTFASAIKSAENDPGRFGVKSVTTSNPGQVLLNSIVNNMDRWNTGQQPAPWIGMNEPHPAGNAFDPTKFVDFMHRRWAPIGAPDDIKEKNGEWRNGHWAPNVRYFLQKLLDEQEYQRLKDLNIVNRGNPEFRQPYMEWFNTPGWMNQPQLQPQSQYGRRMV